MDRDQVGERVVTCICGVPVHYAGEADCPALAAARREQAKVDSTAPDLPAAGRRMKRLARRLVFAQSIDALTFAAFMVIVGPASVHAERNPLIAAIYALGGFAAVGMVKLVAAVIVGIRSQRASSSSRIGVVRRWHERHPAFHPRLAVVLISAATASGIAGAGFNLASLVDAVR